MASKEPTTISSVAGLLAETLEEHYQVDAAALFRTVGMDPDKLRDPLARYSRAKILALWDAAVSATGDPCIGLTVGFNIRPTTYHALGYAWLASRSLLDALERLQRYYQVFVTVPLQIDILRKRDVYMFQVIYTDPRYPPPPVPLDSFLASIVKLCRSASHEDFRPTRVWLAHDDSGHAKTYERLFEAPVRFSAPANALFFDQAILEAPLPGNNLVLATANDNIAEKYLNALDPDKATSDVFRLLVELLPTGQFSQARIAARLNRSVSSLQRQLQTEGTSFQSIKDSTRRDLSEDYVRENKLSISQIAYMLGFSDQSNFSRAFKRWTGKTPGQYQAEMNQD